jgi:hypothetical protein
VSPSPPPPPRHWPAPLPLLLPVVGLLRLPSSSQSSSPHLQRILHTHPRPAQRGEWSTSGGGEAPRRGRATPAPPSYQGTTGEDVRRGKAGGVREGEQSERSSREAVGLQRYERNPRNELREGRICKMKNQMQHLLEAQQRSFDLHYADAELDPASAGVSLSILLHLS